MLGLFLKFAAVTILIGIGCLILFLILGVVWAAWGVFGAMLVFGGALAAFAWWYDRRQHRDY